MPISNFPRLRYSDVIETTVRTTGAFKVAANAVGAETDPDCHTEAVDIQGCKQLDIFVDVNQSAGTTAKLYLKVRFSGKSAPDTTINEDWGYIQTDNVDPVTGISTVQDYLIEIDLLNINGVSRGAAPLSPRRYISRIPQISGRHASVIVWIGGGALDGTVYFMRQGGSM